MAVWRIPAVGERVYVELVNYVRTKVFVKYFLIIALSAYKICENNIELFSKENF